MLSYNITSSCSKYKAILKATLQLVKRCAIIDGCLISIMSIQMYNLFNKKIQNRIQYVNLINLNLKHVTAVAFTRWQCNNGYSYDSICTQLHSWEPGAPCEEHQLSRSVQFFFINSEVSQTASVLQYSQSRRGRVFWFPHSYYKLRPSHLFRCADFIARKVFLLWVNQLFLN